MKVKIDLTDTFDCNMLRTRPSGTSAAPIDGRTTIIFQIYTLPQPNENNRSVESILPTPLFRTQCGRYLRISMTSNGVQYDLDPLQVGEFDDRC